MLGGPFKRIRVGRHHTSVVKNRHLTNSTFNAEGCCKTAQRQSRFLLQRHLVALRIYLYEPYHRNLAGPIHIPLRYWADIPTRSKAAGLPSRDHPPPTRNSPGAIQVTSQSNWQTGTLYRLGYEHL